MNPDNLQFKYDKLGVQEFVTATIDGNHNAVERTLNALGFLILQDAITKPPTPRIDTGQARGSWSIKVGSKPVIYSDGSIGGYSKPSGMLSPETAGMRTYELRVGFNVPYAYNIHEGFHENGDVMKFGDKSEAATPKTGNFFLSSKFVTREKVWLARSQEWYTDFLKKEMMK